MTGDSENKFGNVGGSDVPDSGGDKGDDLEQPRPFRSWASAREESGPSVWTRMRGRLAGMFTRRNSQGATTTHGDGVGTAEDPVAPPDDFRFPWTRPVEPPFESVDAALPADAAKSGGFLSRLLGKRPSEPQRPPEEPEIHQDRIDAAAEALDDVGGETFAKPTSEAPDARDFATVDQALPLIDLSEPPAPPAAQVKDISNTLEILEQKTDEFVVVTGGTRPEAPEDDDDTLRVTKPSLIARLLHLQQTQAEAKQDSPATVVEGNPVFLFAKFRAFYNEIIRFKHQKSEFTAGFSTAIVADHGSDTSAEAPVDALFKRLHELLELQAAEAKWMGGEAGARYPDAQYAMAALADELFSSEDQDGENAWSQNLLEVKLFKTHASDIELFKRIDRLLKDQPNSTVARDLGRVYLLVLAAGFRGKYRQFGLTRALAEYRQRLYEYVHSDDALLLYASDRKIFPAAAEHTLEGAAVSRFTAAQRWTAILIFIVVSYALAAHLAWNRVSEDLEDVTGRIRSTSTATTGAR